MKCQEADATAMIEAQALLDEETPTEAKAYAEPVSKNLDGGVVRGPSPVPDRRLLVVIMGMVIGAGVAMMLFSTNPASANVESDIIQLIAKAKKGKPKPTLVPCTKDKECKVTMYEDKNFKGKATVLEFPMTVDGQAFDCVAKYAGARKDDEYQPTGKFATDPKYPPVSEYACTIDPKLAIWNQANSMKMSSGCIKVILGDDDPPNNQGDESYDPPQEKKFRPDIKDDIKFVIARCRGGPVVSVSSG